MNNWVACRKIRSLLSICPILAPDYAVADIDHVGIAASISSSETPNHSAAARNFRLSVVFLLMARLPRCTNTSATTITSTCSIESRITEPVYQRTVCNPANAPPYTISPSSN